MTRDDLAAAASGTPVSVALLQFAPLLYEVKANLDRVLLAVPRAKSAGAELLIAPEMCLTGWALADSERRTGAVDDVARVALPALREASRTSGVALVVGGPMRVEDGVASNCAIGVTPDGTLSISRKIHLFGDERSWWSAGESVALLSLRVGEIGMLMCYDAEFPEAARMARLAGADLLAIPAANMTPYERDHDLLFPTRALENECPVVVCNRTGVEGSASYFGRSLVADGRGRIIAQAGTAEELLVAIVGLSECAADPQLSYLAHRRPDVYAPILCSSTTARAQQPRPSRPRPTAPA